MFVDTKVKYTYSNEVKKSNYIYLGIVLLILFFFILAKIVFSKKKIKLNKFFTNILKKDNIIIWIMFFILFVVQIVIEKNIYFETSWDVEHIVNTAIQYAKTGIFENNNYYEMYPYFSVYPNNIFLAEIFAVISKIALHFNVSRIYHVLVIIDILLVDLAGIMMVKTVGNLTKSKLAKLMSGILYIAFIGLSPWFLVPYSDTYSIFFTISVLYHYMKNKKAWYDYLFIGVYSYFGYLIKPTAIIVLIAIVIVEAFRLLLNRQEIKEKYKLKLWSRNCACVLMGIILVLGFKMTLNKIIKYEVDKKYSFSYYHYLMMGINTDTTGSFNSGDVTNSLAIEGYDERIKQNKEKLVERIKELSWKDFCDLYYKKILVNYNDGTFAWGREGWFYKGLNEEKSDLANKLKDFYYNEGANFEIFTSIMQTIWIFILVLVMIAAIFAKTDHKKSVIFLSLIGLTLFTLLFEARARYLYLYSTYYIILASIGIEVLLHFKFPKNVS